MLSISKLCAKSPIFINMLFGSAHRAFHAAADTSPFKKDTVSPLPVIFVLQYRVFSLQT